MTHLIIGNHELWLLGKDRDIYKSSFDKFRAILALCDEIGVHYRPKRIEFAKQPSLLDSIWIVPLFSWYHHSLDPTAPPFTDVQAHTSTWVDFALWSRLLPFSHSRLTSLNPCDSTWDPKDLNNDAESLLAPGGSPSEKFLELNREFLEGLEFDAPVISFSHFLPRRDCLPRMLPLP